MRQNHRHPPELVRIRDRMPGSRWFAINWPGLLAASLVFAGSASADLADQPAGVIDPKLAEFNWIMHCQGCHEADGESSGGDTPSIAGNVARFLQVEGGRDYLARVPGVAFVSLSSSNVAELLNWMLDRYDREHIPAGFRPYNAGEVEELRRNPLISTSVETRRLLLQRLAALDAAAVDSAERTKDE